MGSLSDMLSGVDIYRTPGIAPTSQEVQGMPGGMAAARPKFFGQGGAGRNITGYLGDALMQLGGLKPIYGEMMAQRPEMELERQLKQLQIAKLQKPDHQVVNLGDGGVADWTDDGTLNVLREPQVQPKRTPLQENIEFLKTLDPTLTAQKLSDIAQRGIGGYQYSEPYVQQQQQQKMDLIGARTQGAIASKSAPSYANTHPAGAGKTSATRVVGGKAYYKVGGAWYDNPEGR